MSQQPTKPTSPPLPSLGHKSWAAGVVCLSLLVPVRTVDIIERNTVYDEFGKAVFEQVVFWEWDYLSSDYRSVGYVSLADTEVYVRTSPPSCEWKSSIGIHRVNGRQYRKTNTRFDPTLSRHP